MLKVRISDKCSYCHGKAYLPAGKGVDANGNNFIRHSPCPVCEGTGESGRWINISDLLDLLVQAQCPHEHLSTQGGFHFSGGEVWDDIKEVCDDCGKGLI